MAAEYTSSSKGLKNPPTDTPPPPPTKEKKKKVFRSYIFNFIIINKRSFFCHVLLTVKQNIKLKSNNKIKPQRSICRIFLKWMNNLQVVCEARTTGSSCLGNCLATLELAQPITDDEEESERDQH